MMFIFTGKSEMQMNAEFYSVFGMLGLAICFFPTIIQRIGTQKLWVKKVVVLVVRIVGFAVFLASSCGVYFYSKSATDINLILYCLGIVLFSIFSMRWRAVIKSLVESGIE